jgi:hypothetical protein
MHHRIPKTAVSLLFMLTLSVSAQVPPAGAGAVDVCKNLSFPAQPPAGPPVIKPAGQRVRVLAFGDFGDGGKDQLTVAAAMAAYHKDPQHPFDFGITLGDNFYEYGLNSATHPRWKTNWEVPYGPLGIRLYVSLGNHDYYDSASPIAEALYSQKSTSWCLPAAYYTYTAGPVQFFVLDTDSIMRTAQKGQDRSPIDIQKKWLKAQLDASKSPWKVVYGHHPVYSTGQHQDNAPMITEILPVLKQRANVYIAGHDHDMEYLRPESDVYFFISGAGGHEKRSFGADLQKRRLWGVDNALGFSVLEADGSSLSVSFFNENNAQLCKVTLAKGKPAVASCPKP